MSDNLARTAVVEDCFNLMLASEHICAAFKEVCREHLHFAMFGGLARPTDGFAIQLLDRYRNDWELHKTVKEEVGFRSAPSVPKTQSESVLSFILGWVCHRGVDRMLKPVSPEASLYQDAFIFHRTYVFNSHTPAPFRTAHYERSMDQLQATGAINSQDIAEFFSVLQQRFFIEMHTFVPDVDDIEGWFDRLYERIQEYGAHNNRLAEVIMNPDPDQVQQYVTDTDFYHDEDAIIQLAVAIRRGAIPAQAEIDAALAVEPKSQYGRALRQGLGHLMSANAFFTGGIDSCKLTDLLAV